MTGSDSTTTTVPRHRIRSIADFTWRDALLIELQSMLDRVERKMPIAGVTVTRITGLVDEYEKERVAQAGVAR
jgi:hypothetical protein